MNHSFSASLSFPLSPSLPAECLDKSGFVFLFLFIVGGRKKPLECFGQSNRILLCNSATSTKNFQSKWWSALLSRTPTMSLFAKDQIKNLTNKSELGEKITGTSKPSQNNGTSRKGQAKADNSQPPQART